MSLEPTPCDTDPAPFDTFGLDPRLLEGIRDLGFKETRPIQSAVIRLALDGSDLIACAETGTGKTAAFVLPTLQKLLRGQTPGSDPSASTQNLMRAGCRTESSTTI
jgi:ATP-dependent RNA helicase RhlE